MEVIMSPCPDTRKTNNKSTMEDGNRRTLCWAASSKASGQQAGRYRNIPEHQLVLISAAAVNVKSSERVYR